MNKTVARVIALLLCGVLLLGLVVTVFADETEVGNENGLYIFSAQDFLDFAEKCRLDSYSQGLSVYLMADIDLTNVDFSGIPIFSGSFFGGGYTISGLKLTDEGSYQGLFRYLTKTAVVTNLNVSGSVTPGGSRSFVGGIAGSNAGAITDCTFAGDVSGTDNVGGLVGINEIGGVIEGSQANGTIHGDHFVGGIAGENKGKILDCANNAEINTTEVQNSVDLSDISVDSLTGAESSVTITDIGGIAGMSSGTITGCINNGSVGYQYMGYNIGGIAGTNTGYISQCINYCRIYGRKEVGGIVGQLEPYATLAFSTDTLQILKTQVEDLSDMIDTATDNAKTNFDNINSLVTRLEQYVANIESAVDELTAIVEDPQIEDLDDAVSTMETVASLVESVYDCLAGIDSAVTELYSAIKGTAGTLESDLANVSAQIDVISSTLDHASENLGGSVKDISDDDTENLTSSEVAGCLNYGPVLGDLNVGGIVGAIAVENDLDPEEDVDILGDATLNYDAEVRSVIVDCGNTAEVQGRKYQIGGIVGWMSLGLTKNCVNSGTVTATGADYVGGIAGSSGGYIRSCSAKCQLSGDAYVGGIAGAADVVSDCYGLTETVAGTEKLGGIVGCADSRDDITGNYYLVIGTDLGGIDGISYSGAAEPAGLDAFLAKTDLPENFRTVTLRFYTGEDTYTEVVVDLGDSLVHYDIPAVPTRNDCVGVWDGLDALDSEPVYFDAIYTISYDSVITTIEGDQQSGHLPVMLAQGQFASGQTLELEALTLEDGVEGWHFSFPQGGVVSSLRLLLPESCEADRTVVMLRDSESGAWRQVSFTEKGNYLVFNISESDDAVCLMQAAADHTMELVAVIAVCVIAVAVAVILIVKKTRKRKGK